MSKNMKRTNKIILIALLILIIAIIFIFLYTKFCTNNQSYEVVSVTSLEELLSIPFVDDANGEIECYSFPNDDADESQIYIIYPIESDALLENDIYKYSEEYKPVPSSQNYITKDVSFLSSIDVSQEQILYVNRMFTEYNFDGTAFEREILIYVIEKSSDDFYIVISTLYPENIQVDASTIIFDSGEYHDKAWLSDNSDAIYSIDKICVPDRSTAIKLSDLIISNLQDDGLFKNYVVQSVFFDESSEVWILNYYPNEKNYSGSTCSIAISQQTAEILKIWITE
ncbi:MAG: hypothetical protein LUG91_05400 [Ruminococcus sp.]|nr:hypothetical protein [Ruminococcus sp.]